MPANKNLDFRICHSDNVPEGGRPVLPNDKSESYFLSLNSATL